jgi:DNA-binding transcriptional ArsR family regulator
LKKEKMMHQWTEHVSRGAFLHLFSTFPSGEQWDMLYNQTVISLNCYTKGMDAFTAVADPTRRAMLDMLLKKERPAGDFVGAFPEISQPAVSKHLRTLRDAGLVSVQIHAQQRIYSLEPKALAELDAWIAKYKVFWSDSLIALDQHLSEKKGAKKK